MIVSLSLCLSVCVSVCLSLHNVTVIFRAVMLCKLCLFIVLFIIYILCLRLFIVIHGSRSPQVTPVINKADGSPCNSQAESLQRWQEH